MRWSIIARAARACRLVTCLLAISAPSLRAQQPDSVRAATLTLGDAVAAALRASPTILAQTQQAQSAHGALLAARGAFDPQLVTSVDQSHATQFTQSPTDASALLPVLTDETSYDMGVEKQFRSGIAIKPDVSISRSDFPAAPGSVTAQSTVGLQATMPLWKDRFGAVSGASVRAAEHDDRAGALTLRHTVAQSVLDVAGAYWGYVAAVQQLAVFRESEARAQEMLDDTKRLVDAEERPQSDVTQATANLASKRVSRIGAEQSVVEARQQLGLAMGLAVDSIDALPAPATDFPAVDDTTPPSRAVVPGDVLTQRADYAAATESERAASTRAASARNDLEPRLDLTLNLGYVGSSSGFGFGRFLAPLYRNVPGLNASFGLRYELPIANAGAAGRALEAAAGAEQARISREDLARRIRSNVSVAQAALRHGQMELAESHSAVALAETTVRNEQRKFRLDASTMFDVIQAQDAVTNAKLNEIASARTYAVAIATLRFESGALVGADSAAGATARLVTPP